MNNAPANDWVLVVGPKDGEAGDTTVLYNEMTLNVPASMGLGITKATVIQKVTITEVWKPTSPEIGSAYTAKEIKAAEPLVVNIGIYYEKGEAKTWEGGLTIGGEYKKVTVSGAGAYSKSKIEANGGYTEVAVTLTSEKYKEKDVKVDGVVKWYNISYEYEVKDGQSKFLRNADDRKSAGLTIAQLENKPTKSEEIGSTVLKARVWTRDAAPPQEEEDVVQPVVVTPVTPPVTTLPTVEPLPVELLPPVTTPILPPPTELPPTAVPPPPLALPVEPLTSGEADTLAAPIVVD